MRLLDVHTLCFEEFIDPLETPPYVIASHRWCRRPGDETTYKNFKKSRDIDSPGYRKVLSFCALVRHTHSDNNGRRAAGFLGANRRCNWLWIDTACINKSDSAELSESINSMFKWYAGSQLCYAFLHDVGTIENPQDAIMDFMQSEWFLRGWTLQELLAPRVVVFLTSQWEVLGHKCYDDPCYSLEVCQGLGENLNRNIARITNISLSALSDPDKITHLPVEERLLWVSNRTTTRPEDKAYCLLGLLSINLPPIYGEGGNAWLRLEDALQKTKKRSSKSDNGRKRLRAWLSRVSAPEPSRGPRDTQIALLNRRRIATDLEGLSRNPWGYNTKRKPEKSQTATAFDSLSATAFDNFFTDALSFFGNRKAESWRLEAQQAQDAYARMVRQGLSEAEALNSIAKILKRRFPSMSKEDALIGARGRLRYKT